MLVRKTSLFFQLIIFYFLISPLAVACSCASFSLAEKVQSSDNIFIVKVTDVRVLEKGDQESFFAGSRRGYFDVIETLKGSANGLSYIESADLPICCMCQMKVRIETNYLVFQNSEQSIHLSSCGFTLPVSENSDLPKLIKMLVQAYKPTEIYSGIFSRKNQMFLNDDGSYNRLFELRLKEYYSEVSRVSFEGLRMKTGEIITIKLISEQALSKEEIKLLDRTKLYQETK